MGSPAEIDVLYFVGDFQFVFAFLAKRRFWGCNLLGQPAIFQSEACLCGHRIQQADVRF